ncbi:MAG: YggT family protein [Gammaproteobacteria bacterium]|nr:YggT family protein [Gammaproteobacteria bacterium]
MSLGTEILAEFIQLVFGIYIFVVMLRLILQIVRADFYNPISQGIVKMTAPVLNPMRRLIPGLWGIDMASVALMLILKSVELGILFLITNTRAGIAILAIIAVAQLIQLAIYILIGSIFISIVISWINPHAAYQNPVARLSASISDPLMRPARRLIPPMGGIDFSPILVIFLLFTALKILSKVVGV